MGTKEIERAGLRRPKIIRLMLVLVALIAAALIILRSNCPPQGAALSQSARTLVLLKNRTALPEAADFDRRATLAAIVEPGEDRGRWSEQKAAAVEGYVVAVKKAGIEAANCFSPFKRDLHIEVALSPDAPPEERMILEVTPRMKDWAASRGWDWSEPALRREMLGRWCSFEGWLMFDAQHAMEAENTAPRALGNWRATAWEIHPLTSIKVVR